MNSIIAPSTPTISTITSVMPYDCLYKGSRVRFRIEQLRDFFHQEEQQEKQGFSFHHPNYHRPVPHLCYSELHPGEEFYPPPSISHFPVSSITGVTIYPPSRSLFSLSCCCSKRRGGDDGGGKCTSTCFSRRRRLVLKFSRGTSMELVIEGGDVLEEAAVVHWFMNHLIAGREHRRVDWPYRFFLNREVSSLSTANQSALNGHDGCWASCWRSMWTRSAESGLFARKYACGDFLKDSLDEGGGEHEEKFPEKIGRRLDGERFASKKKMKVDEANVHPKRVYTAQNERCA